MEQELQKESKCSFYALEQLRQTAEAILRGSQRLLKCRAGVEKYRTAQPQRAYAYYLELQKTRDALLVALGDAQRYLLELDEPMLVKTAEQLQMGLRRFDLMSRAYKPVYEVLTGFAKSLPQTDTVNAAVIGRLMNHVRMGYYPTDPENIAHILRGIAFPEGVTTNLLDPCCGCGKALRQLADGNNCYTYGMELDEHRAEEAQTRLHRVGFGSFFHSQISRESFHVLFLNPPYLSVLAEGGSRASGMICLTRHSSASGLCAMTGAAISLAGSTVKPVAASLSISRPERTPQKSVARAMAPLVRLMTNSPDSLMIS